MCVFLLLELGWVFELDPFLAVTMWDTHLTETSAGLSLLVEQNSQTITFNNTLKKKKKKVKEMSEA